MNACQIMVVALSGLGLLMLLVTVVTFIVIWRVSRRDYLGKAKR